MNAQRPHPRLLLAVGLALFVFVWAKNAWISDDAHITARALDQLAAGHGPNWNPHERAQVSTSVAWFWLQAPLRAITADFATTVLLLSLACCLALLRELRRLAPSAGDWVLLVGLLVSTRGFMDFTSSGLETPLVLLACAVLARWYLQAMASPPGAVAGGQAVTRLAVGAGLALLIRHDLLVLWAPPVLHAVWHHRRARTGAAWVRLIALAALPIVVWSAAATFYYGSPWPNPAVARLHAQTPAAVAVRQGVIYLASVSQDPLLGLTLAAGTLLALATPPLRGLAIGIGAFGLYLVAVGGDFMQGRFLAGPLLLAAVVLVRRLAAPRSLAAVRARVATIAVVALSALLWPGSPVTAPFDFAHDDYFHGVADERGIYFPATSLWTRWRVGDDAFPDHPWAHQARRDRAAGIALSLTGTGIYGHEVGTDVIVVDHLGVLDPFLARVPPAATDDAFRPGHVLRDVPAGYLESIERGDNVVADPGLRELYDDVRLAACAPLLAPGRASAIARLLARDAHALVR